MLTKNRLIEFLYELVFPQKGLCRIVPQKFGGFIQGKTASGYAAGNEKGTVLIADTKDQAVDPRISPCRSVILQKNIRISLVQLAGQGKRERLLLQNFFKIAAALS